MRAWLQKSAIWQIGWAGLVLAGALVIVRIDIAQRREIFHANARIAHDLLSQRAVQHEAILSTLVLLSPGLHPEQRLPAVYPQVVAVLRRDDNGVWPDPSLQAAHDNSREARRAKISSIDASIGQYTLVLAGAPSSFALRIDALRMVISDQWPFAPAGPTRATLEHEGSTIVLQPGEPVEAQPAGLTAGFVFDKPLAAVSQPFVLRVSRATGPAEWPWAWLLAWTLFSVFSLAAISAWRRVRHERRRAEEMLRVGQVARLNAMGELAGGIAHELNQPLAAILANTQAAQRMLNDDPADLADARQAMAQAAIQGRRAADVVARLRRLIETPGVAQLRQAVHLGSAVRQVLDVLDPELKRRGINAVVRGHVSPVLADPVALEQIMHNLIDNAMHALAAAPPGERHLELHLQVEGGRGIFCVRDSGPGITAEALPHVFEPFYTTRRDGLGLGLGLCETLAHAMDGTLSARNVKPRGAEFRLTLMLAKEPS